MDWNESWVSGKKNNRPRLAHLRDAAKSMASNGAQPPSKLDVDVAFQWAETMSELQSINKRPLLPTAGRQIRSQIIYSPSVGWGSSSHIKKNEWGAFPSIFFPLYFTSFCCYYWSVLFPFWFFFIYLVLFFFLFSASFTGRLGMASHDRCFPGVGLNINRLNWWRWSLYMYRICFANRFRWVVISMISILFILPGDFLLFVGEVAPFQRWSASADGPLAAASPHCPVLVLTNWSVWIRCQQLWKNEKKFLKCEMKKELCWEYDALSFADSASWLRRIISQIRSILRRVGSFRPHTCTLRVRCVTVLPSWQIREGRLIETTHFWPEKWRMFGFDA